MKQDHFNKKDLIKNPTPVQNDIVINHKGIGDYLDLHYLSDGISVLFELENGEYIKVQDATLLS